MLCALPEVQCRPTVFCVGTDLAPPQYWDSGERMHVRGRRNNQHFARRNPTNKLEFPLFCQYFYTIRFINYPLSLVANLYARTPFSSTRVASLVDQQAVKFNSYYASQRRIRTHDIQYLVNTMKVNQFNELYNQLRPTQS